MIAVVQRVISSIVTIDESMVGTTIGLGINVLLGVAAGDGETDAGYLAAKVANLHIFEDDRGQNEPVIDRY